MGGYGSTRWGSDARKRTSDTSFGLDIATLGQYVNGGNWHLASRWQCGEKEVGSIGMHVATDRVTLDYIATRDGDEPERICEAVAVTRTACTYGGTRAWFLCPGCGVRRRVLYLAPGARRFRCRECHRLAYSTQRMDALDRHIHRIHALHKRLGDTGAYNPFHIPPRPNGMHNKTYARIRHEIIEREMRRDAVLDAAFVRLTARWRKRDAAQTRR